VNTPNRWWWSTLATLRLQSSVAAWSRRLFWIGCVCGLELARADGIARRWHRALRQVPPIMLAAAAPPPAEAFSRSHVLCAQAHFVAVSGSYAYVTAYLSDSLVAVDISNPASPVIRGSVASSTVLDGVRVRPGALRARMASGAQRLRPHRPSCSRPRRHRLLTCSPSRAVLTGLGRRCERLVRLRDNA